MPRSDELFGCTTSCSEGFHLQEVILTCSPSRQNTYPFEFIILGSYHPHQAAYFPALNLRPSGVSFITFMPSDDVSHCTV